MLLEETKTEPFLKKQQSHAPFIIAGLGPYARRHYFQLFKEKGIIPSLLIELDSKKEKTEAFLRENHFDVPVFYVPDSEKDLHSLSREVQSRLLLLTREKGITHAVIATEPKAHFAYAEWFLKQGIHVLAEKPLTSPPFASSNLAAADQIEKDFDRLLSYSKKYKARLEIQCHRRYHPVYLFVFEQIEKMIEEFSIPMTFCDIYHCDGMWNMPNEFLERENHPYKYGFGKLLHSGYHFIDLLALLLSAAFKLKEKKPNRAQLYATSFRPADFLAAVDEKNYEQLFQTQKFKNIFKTKSKLANFGELDFFGLLQLFRDNDCMTTCSINLLQTGFNQRAWTPLPVDTYKSNGRVRHERISLQFGPLMNLQVHSYLSSGSGEDDVGRHFDVGNKGHFDVQIFRNAALIGGKPFEKFDSRFFESRHDKSFNETSRSECFIHFINNQDPVSCTDSHQFSIQLLKHCERALCKTPRIEKFIV